MNIWHLIALFFLPALLVLGHDAYLYATTDPQPQHFDFSALGYLWTQYSPDTYKSALDASGEDRWKLVSLLLEQKTIYLTMIFGFFLSAFTFFIKTLILIWQGVARVTLEMKKG